jgi:hypothetical protein
MKDKRIKYVPNHILTYTSICVFVYRRVISLIISNSSSKSTASGSALWSRKNLEACALLGLPTRANLQQFLGFLSSGSAELFAVSPWLPNRVLFRLRQVLPALCVSTEKDVGEGFKRSSSSCQVVTSLAHILISLILDHHGPQESSPERLEVCRSQCSNYYL